MAENVVNTTGTMEKSKITAGTIARTIILALALINQVLLMNGIQMIPISDEEINTLVSTIWTIVASIISWWENNSFSKHAIEADKYMKTLQSSNSIEGTKKSVDESSVTIENNTNTTNNTDITVDVSSNTDESDEDSES